MSKEEEQALKAYPKKGWKCKDSDGNDTFLDSNRGCRLAYVQGYEQAEKDLTLTWRDIRRIVKVADQIVDEDEDGRLLTMSEEDYYKEVLDRYMETIKE